MNIFEKVKLLNLPIGEYVIVGGGVLKAHGIRETQDIDIVVTPGLFEEIKKEEGWREDAKHGGPRLRKDIYEVYLDVNCDSYQPTTDELIERSEVINGIPCISLNDLLLFKKGYGRPKDKPDIQLIEEALSNTGSNLIHEPSATLKQ